MDKEPLKVLIVEDDKMSRQYFEAVVRHSGHEPHAFGNAEAAWEKCQNTHFPLMVLDWMLPGMDGLELCRRIRKAPGGDSSVILVTTVRDRPEDLRAVLQAGADDYLTKPVESGLLKIRLEIARQTVQKIQLRKETEKRLVALREQMSQSDKLVSLRVMISGFAHELNNPLQGILGLSQILAKDLEEGSTQDDVKDIERLTQRCKSIVESILQFSDHDQVHLTDVNINELVGHFLHLWAPKLKAEDIEVVRDFQAPEALVRCDRTQMNQVFYHLYRNAVQAMPSKGSLTISTRLKKGDADSSSVQIEFVDTGAGIPRTDLKRVFDPFFTTKEVGDGMGLGLSVCHGIVQQHKGHLAVESQGPGQGTHVTIELPVSSTEFCHMPNGENNHVRAA